MANYESTYRTNYFRVTDEDKWQEIFKKRIVGEDVYDLSKEENGTILHAFGGYGNIEYIPDNLAEEDLLDPIDLCSLYSPEFTSDIQDILPEGEAFILLEIGNEKLRYVGGYAYIVTAHTSKFIDFTDFARIEAKKILGENFKTQMEY